MSVSGVSERSYGDSFTSEDRPAGVKKKKWHRRFAEQKLVGKRPVLTARAAQLYFVAAGVLCIALGVPILIASLNVVQYRVPYAFEAGFAGLDSAQRQELLWGAGDAGVVYNLSLIIDKDMEPPIYIFYELDSYFQNYRRYVRSLDSNLMVSGDQSASPASACAPFHYLGPPGTNPASNASLPADGSINPCGQIAQSLFNDSFALSAALPAGAGDAVAAGTPAFQPLPIDSSSIAWSNDYKLYGDFIPYNFNSEPAWRGGATVDQPLNTAQAFMVWMRTGAKKTLAKLYGQINTRLPAGTVLSLQVANRYNTYGWEGNKAVVVTTNSWVGGRNVFLGAFYLALGGAALCVALFFFLAYDLGWVWKRKPGQLQDLSWVRDQPDALARANSIADVELRFSEHQQPEGGGHTVAHVQADGQIVTTSDESELVTSSQAAEGGSAHGAAVPPPQPPQQQQPQQQQQHF